MAEKNALLILNLLPFCTLKAFKLKFCSIIYYSKVLILYIFSILKQRIIVNSNLRINLSQYYTLLDEMCYFVFPFDF